ncbi:MAG: exosortase/archaeosortase family protein, partial [Verrucomicrobia bacterium]|nr:exosortase/archaeosortase family protein [Verrucomicrobiota bacterium]
KVLLMCTTLPLAVLANSFRVLVLAFITDKWGYDALHKAHNVSGYVVIILACVMFVVVMRLIGCRDFKEAE